MPNEEDRRRTKLGALLENAGKILKNLFHHEWVQAVEEIVQRGCEITFLTDPKNLAGHRHEQGILTQGTLSRV